MSRPTLDALCAALRENLRETVGDCICDEAYTSRGMEDPHCGWHNALGTTDPYSAKRILALFPELPTGDAEAEAERRYSRTVQNFGGTEPSGTALAERAAFVAGATWQAQQPSETVTTIEELDALPVGSVVLRDGRAWIKSEVPPDGFGIKVGWFCTGIKDYFLRPHLPVTVLDRPEETS